MGERERKRETTLLSFQGPRQHDRLVLIGLCWLYGRSEYSLVPPSCGATVINLELMSHSLASSYSPLGQRPSHPIDIQLSADLAGACRGALELLKRSLPSYY